MEKDKFPLRLFAVQMFYFSGQAIYNTYINLYMSSIGFTVSQIGLIISVSTGFLLLAQYGWGVISDRTKEKNRIILLMYVVCIVVAPLFYLSKEYLPVMLLFTVFSIFFVPIVPLNDNITLELIEKSRWDYGKIRMGGTIGYAVTVLIIGYVLRDRYDQIFWMVSLMTFLCLVAALRIKPVQGYKNRKNRSSIKLVLKNKNLMGLIVFYLMFGLGTSFFYNFYSIYFTSIGGGSGDIGMMMFVCSVAEIPCLWLMYRLVKRFGVYNILLLAVGMTSLRWILLFILKQPVLIILANGLHGFGFTAFTYCLLNYINAKVPKDLRATSQVFNAMISTICSKLIFGYLGGIACELVGTNNMMLFSGVLMIAATLLFGFWGYSRRAELSF